MIKEFVQRWEKGGAVIKQILPQCECGGMMKKVAYLGCVHDDYSSYLLQCGVCKNIEQVDQLFHMSSEQFEENGWVKI